LTEPAPKSFCTRLLTVALRAPPSRVLVVDCEGLFLLLGVEALLVFRRQGPAEPPRRLGKRGILRQEWRIRECSVMPRVMS